MILSSEKKIDIKSEKKILLENYYNNYKKFKFIKKIKKYLNKEILNWFLSKIKFKYYTKNQIVFEKNNPIKKVVFIFKGTLGNKNYKIYPFSQYPQFSKLNYKNTKKNELNFNLYSLTDLYLFEISKSEFLLYEYYLGIKNFKTNFKILENNILFKNIYIKKYLNFIKIKKYNNWEFLYQMKDRVKYSYILINGSVKVFFIKNLIIKSKNNLKINKKIFCIKLIENDFLGIIEYFLNLSFRITNCKIISKSIIVAKIDNISIKNIFKQNANKKEILFNIFSKYLSQIKKFICNINKDNKSIMNNLKEEQLNIINYKNNNITINKNNDSIKKINNKNIFKDINNTRNYLVNINRNIFNDKIKKYNKWNLNKIKINENLKINTKINKSYDNKKEIRIKNVLSKSINFRSPIYLKIIKHIKNDTLKKNNLEKFIKSYKSK